MREHGRKDHIERRMRRMTGMTADRREEVARLNENELWWARCWNCHKQVTGKRSELKTCSHCGVNLWSRHETSSERPAAPVSGQGE